MGQGWEVKPYTAVTAAAFDPQIASVAEACSH